MLNLATLAVWPSGDGSGRGSREWFRRLLSDDEFDGLVALAGERFVAVALAHERAAVLPRRRRVPEKETLRIESTTIRVTPYRGGASGAAVGPKW